MNVIPNTVVPNNFVMRQTKESPFSYYAGEGGNWAVAAMCEEILKKYPELFRATDRDGVLIVTIPSDEFFSGVVEVKDGQGGLHAFFDARRHYEEPHLFVLAEGEKLPAKHVEVVLYRRDLLEPDGEEYHHEIERNGETGYPEYEIVSINARATEAPEPPTPLSMARNMLGMPGGTAATYTAEEFAQAIWYWRNKAMAYGR